MKDMKHFSKRALALVVALVMCLGMMNLTVFAAEGEESTHEHNLVNCATCGGAGTLDETADCPDCDGPADVELATCEKCDGEGKYMVRVSHVFDDDYPCPNGGFGCSGCDDCRFGYAYTYEEVPCEACNGAGKVAPEGVELCGTCGGTGSVTTQVDCTNPDCEDGKVDCTGTFSEGTLNSNHDGTGFWAYYCSVCGAWAKTQLNHAEYVAEMGESAHVKPDEVTEHKDPTCTEDGYDKYTCAVEGCGAEVTKVIPATGGHKKPDEGVVTTKAATCTEEGEIAYACTVCGEEVTEAVPAKGHKFVNGTCTGCGAVKFLIQGSRMAYAYGYGGNPNAGDNTHWYTGPAFGGDHTLTMENLGLKDDKFGMFGEFVTNYATNKTWQCVGFMPASDEYRVDRFKTNLLSFVYTDSEENGKFQKGTLEEVQQYITENGGALYGTAPADNSFIGSDGIVAVWFVADTSVKASGAEYDLTIDPVTAPALRENSEGVEVHCTNLDTLSYDKATGTYNVELTVTIRANAPDNAHVNLVPGLKEAMDKIDTGLGTNDTFQPGDKMVISVTVDNQSGRVFRYDANSAFLATNPIEVEGEYEVGGTGFDGYEIPVVTNAEFAHIARRTNNQPLKDLGVKSLSDETVGAALKGRGYGADTELSNEKIARTYLADYYLDWTNAARAIKGEANANSFEDLTIGELSVFSNGDNNVQSFETCQPVVEALYYFYYARIFTYNGESIYTHMKQCGTGASELESAVPAMLAGTPYVLNVASIAGEETNNGFQNTQFGFRMEFDLTAVVTPPPPVVPNPSYTSLSVNKVWAGDDGESRPASVSVQLYRDGQSYGDPVTLDESNGWSHSWDRLLDSYTWTVGEVNVPEGYTASVSQDGAVVTITNTYVPEEPEEPEDPQEPEDPEEPEEPDEEEIDEPDVPQGDKPDEPEEPEPEEPKEPEEPDEEEIDEPDVPQGDKPDEPGEPEPEEPDEEEIGEPDVPQGDVPQTGDELTLWLGAAAASGLGLAALGLKRREDEEA